MYGSTHARSSLGLQFVRTKKHLCPKWKYNLLNIAHMLEQKYKYKVILTVITYLSRGSMLK